MATAWDGRASAWGEAWTRVRQMTQIRREVTEIPRRSGEPEQPMPDEFWALRAEAELLVGLVGADVNTGIIAGAWLEENARREAEEAELRRIQFADIAEQYRKKDGSDE